MVSLARLGVALGLVGVVVLLVIIAGLRRFQHAALTWFDWVALVLAGTLALTAADAFHEPYAPEIVRTTVTSPKLPADSRPIRIVHLSDIHAEGHVRIEGDLPPIVRGLHPDLIVFTGDAVNEDAGVAPFRRLMSELAQIAPTYAVRGNWDVWWFPHANLFGGTGVRELKGEAVPLDVRGREIWIAGSPVDSERTVTTALAGVPKTSLLVFLHHFPWAARMAAAHGADLHLAGDTHGGQLRLPLLGELVRIHRHGVWRPLGLGRDGATWTYVNRGIGMEGGMPPVRLLCRPEVTLIEVKGAP
jgi:uncharacterized protein